MQFRPCIDILGGKVKQIVGSSLNSDDLITNFVSEKPANYYAEMFKRDGLLGGHLIMLDKTEETKKEALSALEAYPNGLQIGGGITPSNAQEFLQAGASQVIISSYIFEDGQLSQSRLDKLIKAVGKDQLVLDLSCRKKGSKYYVAINKWQTFTDFEVNLNNLEMLSNYCSEFLIHGVDSEGKKQGIETELLKILSSGCRSASTTYAGGIKNFKDIDFIRIIGQGNINFTVGSALDIFGGEMEYNQLITKLC